MPCRRLAALDRQLVCSARAVGAHQDLAVERLLIQLLEREVEHGDVVRRVFEPAFPGRSTPARASPEPSR